MSTLEDKLRNTVMAAALCEQEAAGLRPGRARASLAIRWIAPALACIALALILLPSGPKDTFTDPQQAYAELEKTFAYISRKIEMGSDIAAEAQAPIIETINNLYK